MPAGVIFALTKTSYMIQSFSTPKLFIVAFIFSLLHMTGCKSGDAENAAATEGKNDTAATVSNPESKLYSLPAPMQIASAIKKADVKFENEIVCPIKANYTSDFNKAIHLGMYGVDLGYANVYDQKQVSINYFGGALKLADELKVLPVTEPGIINRFKENINNQDSVTFYTLSSFNNMHTNLMDGNRANEAYVILSGSFIEGLYLSTSIYQKKKNEKVAQIIAHQKLFLESLIELLSDHTDKKEVADLSVQFKKLKEVYDMVNLKYADMSLNLKKMETVEISDDVISKIHENISELRKEIIK